MRLFAFAILAALLVCSAPAAADNIAPTGTLRAVYLGTNPAQAMRDPATGEVRGPAYDLTRGPASRCRSSSSRSPARPPSSRR
jgi:polar amino acid transport system substrate-binding protein